MANEITPHELKRYLDMLKHALRSIESQCKRGLVPGDVVEVRRHIDNIREAARGVEAAYANVKEQPISKEKKSNAGLTYHPGAE